MKRTRKQKRSGPIGVYKGSLDDKARKLALLGSTNKDIADFFEVSIKTIEGWIKNKKSFREALNQGRIIANANVAESLYKSAIGYSHPDTQFFIVKGKLTSVQTTKHYPPNAVAAIKWLSIRDRERWAETTQHEVTHKGVIEHIHDNFSDFDDNELKTLYKFGLKTANANKN